MISRIKKTVLSIVLAIIVMSTMIGCEDPVLKGAIDCVKEGHGVFSCGLEPTTNGD